MLPEKLAELDPGDSTYELLADVLLGTVNMLPALVFAGVLLSDYGHISWFNVAILYALIALTTYGTLQAAEAAVRARKLQRRRMLELAYMAGLDQGHAHALEILQETRRQHLKLANHNRSTP